MAITLRLVDPTQDCIVLYINIGPRVYCWKQIVVPKVADVPVKFCGEVHLITRIRTGK